MIKAKPLFTYYKLLIHKEVMLMYTTVLKMFYRIDPLNYMPRCGWEATPPKQRLENLHLPVSYVIISHTEMSKCDTNDQCCQETRHVQDFGFITGLFICLFVTEQIF